MESYDIGDSFPLDLPLRGPRSVLAPNKSAIKAIARKARQIRLSPFGAGGIIDIDEEIVCEEATSVLVRGWAPDLQADPSVPLPSYICKYAASLFGKVERVDLEQGSSGGGAGYYDGGLDEVCRGFVSMQILQVTVESSQPFLLPRAVQHVSEEGSSFEVRVEGRLTLKFPTSSSPSWHLWEGGDLAPNAGTTRGGRLRLSKVTISVTFESLAVDTAFHEYQQRGLIDAVRQCFAEAPGLSTIELCGRSHRVIEDGHMLPALHDVVGQWSEPPPELEGVTTLGGEQIVTFRRAT